jgi:DNA mismatch repair protein MutS
VSSAIKTLDEKGSIFMFATHLHQLKDIKKIQNLKKVQSLHLSINLNEDTGDIEYNRKLKVGQGSSIYGLEFARSMNMDKDFLSLAYEIRNEIADDLDKYDLLIKAKRSKYNSQKYVLECDICGAMATEEHHINEQKDTNSNGLIKHFHKNNKSNILNVCKKCHDKIHNKELKK